MKLTELIVLTGTVLVLFALGVKALQNGHETADVIACKANLAGLAQAVVQYEEAQGFLPPLYVTNFSGLPGWNIRLLPFMGHAAVHELLMESGVYSIPDVQVLAAETVGTNGWWTVAVDLTEKPVDRWLQHGAIFEALAGVAEYRCPTRQPNAIIKGNGWAGVGTDYATPLIFTDFNFRTDVTFRFSSWELESPLKPYELNPSENTWWSVRKSDDWRSGKANTLLISEKYIPDWALEEDDFAANVFNGGLHINVTGQSGVDPFSLRGACYRPQSTAAGYLTATNPIVADNTSPITRETLLHSRRTTAPELVDSYNWHGDYAWGSHHAGVIVAAMGDGSVRTINKNMNASTFYNLMASNVLPGPTDEELALWAEEAEAIAIFAGRTPEDWLVLEIQQHEKDLAAVTATLQETAKLTVELASAVTVAEQELQEVLAVRNAAALTASQTPSDETNALLLAATEQIVIKQAAVSVARQNVRDNDVVMVGALERRRGIESSLADAKGRLEQLKNPLPVEETDGDSEEEEEQ